MARSTRNIVPLLPAAGTSHTATPGDTLALADLALRELAYARSVPESLALADSATPQLVSGSAEVVPRAILLRL